MISTTGWEIKTPNMDRLARLGVAFENAHCAAPLCCPSRAAIFSGQQPFTTGIYHNGPNIRKLHPDKVLLPQYFAAHGYRTFGTGKLLHHTSDGLYDEHFKPEQRWSPLAGKEQVAYTKEELRTKTANPRHVVRFGPDKTEVVLPLNRMPSDRNPTGANGESFDWGPFDVEDEEMGDGKITSWAIERLNRKADKPFFLGVGYYRPHIPLWAPKRYFDLYPEQSTILPKVLANDLDDLGEAAQRWALEPVTAGAHKTVVEHGQWKAAVAAYLACVSFVDAQIGRLLDALEDSPYRDNTIIVIWGDHGWHLGEKQHWGKWTGWERSTRVPLLIVPPRSGNSQYEIGATCRRPVGLIDLYGTLIDLCGLPRKTDLDGESLRPLLQDPSRETEPEITTFDHGNYSVRSDRWRLIHQRGIVRPPDRSPRMAQSGRRQSVPTSPAASGKMAPKVRCQAARPLEWLGGLNRRHFDRSERSGETYSKTNSASITVDRRLPSCYSPSAMRHNDFL